MKKLYIVKAEISFDFKYSTINNYTIKNMIYDKIYLRLTLKEDMTTFNKAKYYTSILLYEYIPEEFNINYQQTINEINTMLSYPLNIEICLSKISFTPKGNLRLPNKAIEEIRELFTGLKCKAFSEIKLKKIVESYMKNLISYTYYKRYMDNQHCAMGMDKYLTNMYKHTEEVVTRNDVKINCKEK